MSLRDTSEPPELRDALRCGAKTRDGTPCQSPAVEGKVRCRLHGGAEGSGAPPGRRNGSYKSGQFTAEAIEERQRLRDLAMTWLRDQVDALHRTVEQGSPAERANALDRLLAIRGEPDLAEVRGATALEKLPAPEQERWKALWADIDVLARRTRALLQARDESVAVAADVAALLAPELGWDEGETARQVDAYRAVAAAEVDASTGTPS